MQTSWFKFLICIVKFKKKWNVYCVDNAQKTLLETPYGSMTLLLVATRLNVSSLHTFHCMLNEIKTWIVVLYSIWIRFPLSTMNFFFSALLNSIVWCFFCHGWRHCVTDAEVLKRVNLTAKLRHWKKDQEGA